MPVNFSVAAETAPQQQQPKAVERVAAVIRPDAVIPNSLIELQKAQGEAKDLKQYKAEHGNPRDALGQAGKTESPPLSPTEQKQLERVNPKIAKEVSDFDVVSSVRAEMAATKKTEAEVLATRGVPPPAEFKAMADGVADRLIAMKYVRELIPDFDKITKPNVRRAVIDALFVSNDLVREKYLAKIRTVVSEAAKLPIDPETAHGEKTTVEGRVAQAQKDKTLESIQKRLGAVGKDEKQIETTEIDALFEGDKSPEEAADALFNRLLDEKGVNPVEYRTHRSNQSELTKLAEEQKNAKGERKNEIGERIKTLKSEIEASKINANSIRIGEAREAVYGHEDERGRQIGGVEAQLRELSTQRKQVEGATSKIELTPEQQQAQESLKVEKERLGRELSEALEDSIEATVLEQCDELSDINGQKFLADAEKQKKQGQVELAKDAEHINKVMVEDGSHLENGKRVYNFKKLKEKLTYIVDHGKDDGGSRSMLHDVLTRDGRTITVFDKSGSEVTLHQKADGKLYREDDSVYVVDVQVKNVGSEGYTSKTFDASTDTISLGSLVGESKQLLDHINSQRDVYLHQLRLDYQLATSSLHIWDLGQAREMSFTNDQRAKLVQEFGIEDIKEVQKEAKRIANWKQMLEDRGVDSIEGFSGTALLMLLSLLGVKKKED